MSSLYIEWDSGQDDSGILYISFVVYGIDSAVAYRGFGMLASELRMLGKMLI